MAKKVGKCINIECDNYKQLVEVEPGEEFVCPKCHQSLEEGASTPQTTRKPLVKWLIVGLLAVAAIGAVVVVVLGTGSKKPEPVDEATEQMEPKDQAAETVAQKPDEDTDTMVAAPSDKIEYTREDSILFGLGKYAKGDVPVETATSGTPTKDGNVQGTSTNAKGGNVQATKPSPKKVANGKGTVNLGYGTYHGDLKNGKPHGYGKITYKKNTRIVPSKDFVVNPGDTFEGEFRDGRISGIGYWSHNGNQTAVKP